MIKTTSSWYNIYFFVNLKKDKTLKKKTQQKQAYVLSRSFIWELEMVK